MAPTKSKSSSGKQARREQAIAINEEGCENLHWLLGAQKEQLTLCQQLEEIADSLPSRIDRQKCIYAAKALGPLIRGMHHYEEEVVFPWIATSARPSLEIGKTLDRLKTEHWEDQCFAEELAEALLRLGSGEPSNMEAVGYMLRGFFECVRRHIAFEKEYLLRLLPDSACTEIDLDSQTRLR